MSYSGKFKPKNYKKYKGDPTKIYYRSLWERRFMVYCDNNPNIIEWGSEEIIIPYRSPVDKKVHRYFPDFIVCYLRKDGIEVTEMVEIKPQRQVDGPNPNPKRRTKSWMMEVQNYIINQKKWEAATKQCEDRGWNFRLLTEKNVPGWTTK